MEIAPSAESHVGTIKSPRHELDRFLDEAINLFGAERSDSVVREAVGPRGQVILRVDALGPSVWVRGALSLLEVDVRAVPLAAIHRVILEVAPGREKPNEGHPSVVDPGATLRCETVDGGEECFTIRGPDETWKFARALATAWARAHDAP